MFIAALVALAILPAAASAAPKKVFLRFSASAYSVTEANTTFNVTVLRTGNKSAAVDVDYATGPGTTATAANYDFTAGTLHFAANETQKTFPVTIKDNATFDPPNKKIVFKLSHAQSAAPTMIKADTTTLTIIDNDGPGTLDFSSPTYSVVESAGVATVTVTRNGNPLLSESVDYATTQLAAGSGHASAGTDYTTTSGTVTFGTNEMSKTFQVPVSDDQSFEGDETLNLTLSNPKNLTNPLEAPTLGPNTPATLTIADDDVPTFSFSDATYSVNEDDGTATITVTRGGATYVPASIDYSDAGGGTARAIDPNHDYTLASGTLDFAANETSKSFTVDVVDDGLNEGNETVNLQLTDGATQVDTAQLSIVDDDNPLASVQFGDPTYSVNEDATTATVTVTLSKAADADVTVDYATLDGTATAGTTATDGSADYEDTSGTLTFTPGQTSKTIDVPLHPDTAVEDDEDFTVTLSAQTNSVLGSPVTTTVTIVDDDDFGNLEFAKQRYDVNETDGHATLTVRRVGGSGGAVSVDYATSDGTAAAPGDYATTSGTLRFADGETSKTFDVPVNWDGIAEGDETISLALSNPADGADLATNTAAVIHVADDGASRPVQFSAGSYDVTENGGAATITVNRSAAGSLGGPVTVDYASSDGTAHAGADYAETHGTLTFGPGDTSKTFQVPVSDDNVRQGGRTLNLTLSNPGGGTAVGSPATAALNIGDNESTSSPSTDRTAPKLKLTAKKLQKALTTKRIVLKVRSNEAASLKLTVKIRKGKGKKAKVIVLKTASKKVAAGKTVTINVTLTKKTLATLTKALVKGKAKVTLSVKGTDAAKNSATVTTAITVR